MHNYLDKRKHKKHKKCICIIIKWNYFAKNNYKKKNYTITNWRVSLSKICHEWPNNTVTTVFGHEWHIFDNQTRQLCYSIYHIDEKCFESNLI
jgi:hypothetical protein